MGPPVHHHTDHRHRTSYTTPDRRFQSLSLSYYPPARLLYIYLLVCPRIDLRWDLWLRTLYLTTTD